MINKPTEINAKIPTHFRGLAKPARYKVYYGGRGGGKSWSFAKALVIRAYSEKLRILCTREFQNSIADSVHRLLVDQIESLGLNPWFKITKTSITSKTGSEFIFKGLARSIQEIKSTEGVDICWVEEAQNTSESSWKTLIPTIRKDEENSIPPENNSAWLTDGNSEFWVSFNPENEEDPTYTRFIINTPPESVVKKVNWSENPHFPEVLNKERLYMLETDPDAYDWVWEGNCRQISDAQVLKGKYEVTEFDEPPEGTTILYGADFGFSQDPSTLVRFWELDKCLYISHEAYQIGVELDDMPDFYKTVPGSEKWPIKADCSRPETISHIKRKGFDISAAKKWAGSVEDGVTYLRSYRKVYIHARCKHTQTEARLYKYKVDKVTEKVLPIIEDKHNHIWDGVRYGLDGRIKQHGFFSDCHGILEQMQAETA